MAGRVLIRFFAGYDHLFEKNNKCRRILQNYDEILIIENKMKLGVKGKNGQKGKIHRSLPRGWDTQKGTGHRICCAKGEETIL